MNISNITIAKSFIIPANQVYYVEELCQPYIKSLNRIYITVAVFNLFYSFVWLFLKNRRDKILFSFSLDEDDGTSSSVFEFRVKHIAFMLDIIFFILNFFVVGYWLLLKNPRLVIDMPLASWFV